MITIHVNTKKRDVIYFKYITGYNSLFESINDVIANNNLDFDLEEMSIILN